MKYRIISVGKIRESFYLAGIKEYLKRMGPYCRMEFIDGLDEKVNPRAGQQEIDRILEKEAEHVFKLITDNEILLVLDSQGKQISSEMLADYIAEWNISGKSRVNLLVGSSHGLSAGIKKKADRIISFSMMTFPHQMATLILTEQIYRGFKILRGEPYHK